VNGRRFGGNDDVDAETNEFHNQLRQSIEFSFRRAKLDRDVLPVDIAEFPEALAKLTGKRLPVANQQHAQLGPLCRLRRRRERPQNHASDREADEFAPPHSLTSPLFGLTARLTR